MRFIYFLLLTLLLPIKSLQSQEIEEVQEHWQLLFDNKREKALDSFEKLNSGDLQALLSDRLIKNELGLFEDPKNFLEKLVGHKDFEYYLYALWNHSFFFENYTNTGFNKKNTSNVDAIDLKAVENPTVKESLRYLKSAIAQHRNDWKTYYELNQELPCIKAWQFCGGFENLNGSGLDTSFAPEWQIASQNDFNANSNGFINWYTPIERDKEAYQYYSNHTEYGSSVNYAQTFIDNPEEQKVVIRFGSSSLAKIWLNDVLLVENNNDGITDLDAYNVEVTLPKGTSRLLVKTADVSGIPYFIARITNHQGAEFLGVKYSSQPTPYIKSKKEGLAPVLLEHPVEKYFLEKIESDPKNFLYRLCLLNSYLRNSKYQEAKAVLQPYLEKYDRSSFLRKYLIECYTKENDFSAVNEVKENIINDDETYYLSYVYKFQDAGELFKLPIDEFERFMNNFSDATDLQVLKKSAELMKALRREDQEMVRSTLNAITKENKEQLNLIKIYLNLYSGYLNDDESAVNILEEINKEYFDYSAIKSLAEHYEKQNRISDALGLFETRYDLVKNDNLFISELIGYLHKYKRFKESLPYIEQMLANYPYSFVAMEKKAFALEQIGKKEEALHWYQKALKHNGANTTVRKKIDDLSKTPDYFKELGTQDMYGFITSNREQPLMGSYGYHYLLDETLLQLFPEGGGKSQVRYAVKITSDAGIESLKEVGLGLSGSYHITKSEIVKPTGKIVPASVNGSDLVFSNLEIDDVIYIEYESSYSKTGRFYKDHVDYFQFESYHPIIKNSLKILVPKNHEFDTEIVNGEIDYSKRELDNYVLHEWGAANQKPMPQPENYMPSLSDLAKYIHMSTIGSWDDVAQWYADLVRPQMLINSDVKRAFESIFPEGYSAFSEDMRASRIYHYIMENFSYSYVGFRQSGYVPQKPSKTIKSRLGDCKDFSTLYVTLAQMAGLRAHLVLVLTSDYGENSMILPNQDFNHCIAKVFIDGKAQYLELTDNNLPFRSIPTSLEHATALDIPNKNFKKVSSGIYRLDNIAHTPTVIESHMRYKIGKDDHELQVESILKGSIVSHYAGIFKENNAEMLKNSIKEDFQGRMSEDFSLDSVYNVNYKRRAETLKYVSKLSVNEKLNQIGSMKVLSLPAINNAYNSSIIEDNVRNYPIDYLLYENADEYISSYLIVLSEDEEFVEVPENSEYSFKAHHFNMNFELKEPNELFVQISVQTSKKRIDPQDYKDFKMYVKSVLNAKKQLIGFKKAASTSKVSLPGKG
ncbi:MAG: hypothetical protein CML04_03875 [Pseudozobellia sp.]|nr:hypothetical protein [Pseudozobellia sp.]MBG49283.1 hypothetical protein [Pseudozobellia sp.]|tara:strand:- start:2207 stop:6007 length:3801 start_codon:yes stop_codon:yes gene_type:complete